VQAVEQEEQLRVGRLLDPERAVIVEDRDACGRRHELRAAFRRDGGNEVEQRALARPLAP